MNLIGQCAYIGNRVIDIIVILMAVIMLLFGAYSLYDIFHVYKGASLSSEILKSAPGTAGNADDTVNVEALFNKYPDMRAWLNIFDTNINYPIVQGIDDAEYLNKDIDGEFSLAGSIFLSSLCNGDLNEHYSLVYGHHMDNGAMFGDVEKFLDKSFFDSHVDGILYTKTDIYDVKVFAVLETDAYNEKIYFPYFANENKDDFYNYLQKNAVHIRDVNRNNKVITMSTCTESYTNGRIVLFGELIRR